jgi:hypothetical protein
MLRYGDLLSLSNRLSVCVIPATSKQNFSDRPFLQFSDRFPDRDLSTDLLPVGAACGYTGAASALLCVALAHQMTQEAGAPVLAISASDAQQRGAIAMSPPAGADVEAPQDAQDAAAVAA